MTTTRAALNLATVPSAVVVRPRSVVAVVVGARTLSLGVLIIRREVRARCS